MAEIHLPVTYLGRVKSGKTQFTSMDIIDQNGGVHPGLIDPPTEDAWRAMKANDIDAIGPYMLEPGTRRANDNVKFVTALILDIDQTMHDMASEGWAEYVPHPALAEHHHYVVASPSNGWRKNPDTRELTEDPGCYSWKVIYPLGTRITANALGKVQRSIVLLSVGGPVATDRQTHDASRPCYMLQGAAPHFAFAEFNADKDDIGKESLKLIVEEAMGLDPDYVENVRARHSGEAHDPSKYVIDRVKRRRGGQWWLLDGKCPLWLEDEDEPRTVADFFEEYRQELAAGIDRDKVCGTIFGGSVRRCILNMAGGMLTISDMKTGFNYGYRPPLDMSDPLDSRRVPQRGWLDQHTAADEIVTIYGDLIAVDEKGFPFLYDVDERTWVADMGRDRLIDLTRGYSGRLTKQDKKGAWGSPFSWSYGWGRDVVTTLTAELRKDPMRAWDDGIAFQDGLLSYDGSFRERTARDYVRDIDVLPYEYTAGAECPRWEQFLEEVIVEPLGPIGETAREALQMYLGACLAGKATRCNVMMVLTGEGANGKSVFLNTIKALFSPAGVACVTPPDWANPNNAIQLYNARVNIVTDVGDGAWRETGVIKRAVSGEDIPMKVLYKDAFSSAPKAGHWFSMNRLPAVWDESRGWSRRARVIPFERYFSPNEQDRDLESKLLDELPGIALWAMNGLRKAEATRFRIPELESEVEQEWNESNKRPDVTFVEQWMVPGPVAYSAEELYPYYQAHARRVGEKYKPLRAFQMALSRSMKRSKMRERVKVKGNWVWVYNIEPLEMDLIDGTFANLPKDVGAA